MGLNPCWPLRRLARVTPVLSIRRQGSRSNRRESICACEPAQDPRVSQNHETSSKHHLLFVLSRFSRQVFEESFSLASIPSAADLLRLDRPSRWHSHPAGESQAPFRGLLRDRRTTRQSRLDC